MNLKRKIVRWGVILTICYVVVFVFLFLFQRKLMFPGTSLLSEPESREWADMWKPYERLFPVGTGKDVCTLQGWMIERPGCPLVVFYGGNAQDVADTVYSLKSLAGYAGLTVNYRGYGNNPGSPGEKVMVSDALEILDRVVAETGRTFADVVVIGQSMGSGVATQVAAARPIRNLVLLVPFDSAESVAAGMLPLFPVRWILKDTFRSDLFAPRVKCPVSIIAAGKDEVIPVEHARRLSRLFPGLISYVELPEMKHNTFFTSPLYDEAFINGVNAVKSGIEPAVDVERK